MKEFNNDLEKYIQKRHSQEKHIEEKIKKKRKKIPKVKLDLVDFFYDKPEIVYDENIGTEVIKKRRLKFYRFMKHFLTKKEKPTQVELKEEDVEKEEEDITEIEEEMLSEELGVEKEEIHQPEKKCFLKSFFQNLFNKKQSNEYDEDLEEDEFDDEFDDELIISRDELQEAFKIANSLIKKLPKEEVANFKKSDSYETYYNVMMKLDLVKKKE